MRSHVSSSSFLLKTEWEQTDRTSLPPTYMYSFRRKSISSVDASVSALDPLQDRRPTLLYSTLLYSTLLYSTLHHSTQPHATQLSPRPARQRWSWTRLAWRARDILDWLYIILLIDTNTINTTTTNNNNNNDNEKVTGKEHASKHAQGTAPYKGSCSARDVRRNTRPPEHLQPS